MHARVEVALEHDAKDPLRGFAERFHIPKRADGGKAIYFCGHSLGLQPKTTAAYVQRELADWVEMGVKGHGKEYRPWYSYHELVRDYAAKVVGCKPTEVVAMNSLTTNLHLLMVSFYQPTPKRFKIVIEKHAFPSDVYAVKSQISYHGYNPDEALVVLEPEDGQMTISAEQIDATLALHGESIALIMLGGVNYLTGQAFDMKAIAEKGHKIGAYVGFDLAHAAGNLDLKLHDWNIDFACWCTYKYLNSGPGSIAGCFVHEKASAKVTKRFEGWWGHDKAERFLMQGDFKQIGGAESWQLSNPPILPLACYLASLEIFTEAGMTQLRRKSVQLTAYLEQLLREELGDTMTIITPPDPEKRGAQLSIIMQTNAEKVWTYLNEQGIYCDLRKPNIIRIAPVPLYNGFEDVYRLVQALKEFHAGTKHG
ncbi:MAG: kynureninase [Oligoflexales bacterium]